MQRAQAILENALGLEHPQVAAILEDQAVVLRKMRQDAKAIELEARVRAMRRKFPQEVKQ